jgi:hypothetical protein
MMDKENRLPDYIFIVGMPRTGTNLLRNILNGAEEVSCKISPETHFVGEFVGRGGRGQMHRIGNMNDDANVRKLVDAMFAEQFAGNYWKQLSDGRLGVEREALTKAILASDRSDRAIYEILLRIPHDVTADSIAGDKTPTHVFHVPTLVDWFPNAKIIHTFRDPRAIYVSQTKKKRDKDVRGIEVPWKSSATLFNMSLLMYTVAGWIRAAQLHQQYQKAYPDQYYLIQFEQIVADPEGSLESLCSFLNLELEPGMLQPIRASSSYKSGVSGTGFDQEALTRWRNYINPTVDTLFQTAAGKYLRQFGYL